MTEKQEYELNLDKALEQTVAFFFLFLGSFIINVVLVCYLLWGVK